MPADNRQHYRGSYARNSKRVRQAAAANPRTRCWRCGLTLAEHAPHHNGKPATWQAGHLNDGDPTSALLPEASTCNSTAGAITGNKRGKRGPLSW